jgi:hypothetical protein
MLEDHSHASPSILVNAQSWLISLDSSNDRGTLGVG